MITVSIVSHGHGEMVVRLIHQLLACPDVGQIILTVNIPEFSTPQPNDRLLIIHNSVPTGFGANHNAAFKFCKEPFFCVVNPDIQLLNDPFPSLLSCLTDHNAAMAAPLVLSPAGKIEDSVRRFPTLLSLLSKAVGGPDGRYHISADQAAFYPDWIAGMFMLFNSCDFDKTGGFDEVFFLYYEDVDICVRLWKSGLRIVSLPQVSVVHDAHRSSHKNLRFMYWHVTSIMRYFIKHFGKLPRHSERST